MNKNADFRATGEREKPRSERKRKELSDENPAEQRWSASFIPLLIFFLAARSSAPRPSLPEPRLARIDDGRGRSPRPAAEQSPQIDQTIRHFNEITELN